MKFIVDTQLPPKLASYLRAKDYDCIHTIHFKDGHLFKDGEIVKIAISNKEFLEFFDKYFADIVVYFQEGNELVEFGRTRITIG